jgi:hypothetical protein
MEEQIRQLRRTLSALRKRKDIHLIEGKLRPKVSRARLAKRQDLPEELIEFYALANGVHIEWEFKDAPGGACLCIPPIGEMEFGTDEDFLIGTGTEEFAALDVIQPEGLTWYVRKPSGALSIVFAGASGEDPIVVAPSLQAYLALAIENGFVHYWPPCVLTNAPRYADQREAILHFKKLQPKKKICAGERVVVRSWGTYGEAVRGEVVKLHKAPKAYGSLGKEFALVRLDHGTTVWSPCKNLRVEDLDCYARAFADPGSFLERLCTKPVHESVEDVLRATGPCSYIDRGEIHNTGWIACGVLSSLSFDDAYDGVLSFVERLFKKLSTKAMFKKRQMTKTGGEVDIPGFDQCDWKVNAYDALSGLCSGLVVKYEQLWRRSKPPITNARKARIRKLLKSTKGDPYLKKTIGRLNECVTGQRKPERWNNDSMDASQKKKLGLSGRRVIY